MGKRQTIRLNEAQLRRIISESVRRMLNENESDPLEQAVEKCRRPYRNYRMINDEVKGLVERYCEDENERGKETPIARKINKAREQQYKLLEYIVNLVNSASDEGDLLRIAWGDYESEWITDGPWLEDAHEEGYYATYWYGSFEYVFEVAMQKNKTLSQAFEEVRDWHNSRKKEEENWEKEIERQQFDDMKTNIGKDWIEDYEPPKDTPLKVLGKMKLSDKDLNKKRW